MLVEHINNHHSDFGLDDNYVRGFARGMRNALDGRNATNDSPRCWATIEHEKRPGDSPGLSARNSVVLCRVVRRA
jgi:hypothetical protein